MRSVRAFRCWQHLAVAVVLCLLTADRSPAQKPPDPGLSYMYPPVVVAGRTTEVTIAGNDWTPDTDILVHDSRVRLQRLGSPGRLLIPEPPFVIGPKAYSPPPLPREQRARISVPADVPPGPVYWQLANANGVSRAGVFFVVGQADLVEPADRREPIRLTRLPASVSGRLRRNEEVDRYAWTPTRDGPVTCRLVARRLGSDFRGVLEIRTRSGRLVADAADTRGHDLSLTAWLNKGTAYTIAVRELDFRGHRSYVYRLQVRDGGRILTTLPAALQRPSSGPVALLLDNGRRSPVTITRQVTVAADVAGRINLDVDGRGHSIPTSGIVERTETSLSSDDGHRPLPSLPIAVTGQLATPEDRDVYPFVGRKGQRLAIEVFAARLGGGTDVSLTLTGPDGKVLGTSDDSRGTTDPQLAVTLPTDGRYLIALSDLAGKTNQRHRVYRLAVRLAVAGFQASCSQVVKLVLGSSVELPITAVRKGGFDGPIRLAVDGLPAGVTIVSGLEIPQGQSAGKLKLQAAKTAASLARLIRITATARIQDRTVTQEVQAPAGVNRTPRPQPHDAIPTILLATTMAPRTRIQPVESDERTVHRGSTHPAPIRVERLLGYAGPVLVRLDGTQPAKFRQGLPAPDVVMPADKDVVFAPVFVPSLAETLDAYRVAFVAVTPVKDPAGRTRHLLSKMKSNTSVAITVEGGLMSLEADGEAVIRVDPTGRFELPVRLLRSAKLQETTLIDVEFSGPLSGRFTSVPLTTKAAGRFRIAVTPSGADRVRGRHTLRIVALVRQPYPVPTLDTSENITPLSPEFLAILRSKHLPVIAETRLVVDFGE